MAAVVVKPLMKLKIVLAPSSPTAIIGAEGAMDTNAAMESIFAPRRELLTRCFPGRTNGFDDILEESLRKATMEPVNVIPPMRSFSVRRDPHTTSCPCLLTNENTEVCRNCMEGGKVTKVC